MLKARTSYDLLLHYTFCTLYSYHFNGVTTYFLGPEDGFVLPHQKIYRCTVQQRTPVDFKTGS